MSSSPEAEADEAESPSEECRIITDAVLDVAVEHCSTEEEVFARIARQVGVEPDVDCNEALSEGLNRETCGSSKGHRQWIACRAQQLRRTEELGLGTALEQAWEEAKTECMALGIEV